MIYTDSDQPNMWLAAVDFSEGRFYEPRYYGQAYNTNMEALFAVPLLWLNVPVYYALPVVTHLIALFPLFFIGLYLYAKKRVWNAAIILGLSLCFPLGNDMLSSLPRGFVTGLFFIGFFVTSMLEPRKLSFVFINTLLAVLAFFASPNTLLVSAPFLFFLFL
ncbi:MAG: hypothetical protein JNL60_17875, partial [Bacteroidia bacterium]|nr:hypothetical protein [Bacteroidia bacterium]